MLYGFYQISKSRFEEVVLPSETDIDTILTCDTFGNIKEEIERKCTLEVPRHIRTDLIAIDVKNMVNRVFFPLFNLVLISKLK